MKVSEIKEKIKDLPDDAELTVRTKDKWDVLEVACKSLGLLLSFGLIFYGVFSENGYAFLGAGLVYLFLIKE